MRRGPMPRCTLRQVTVVAGPPYLPRAPNRRSSVRARNVHAELLGGGVRTVHRRLAAYRRLSEDGFVPTGPRHRISIYEVVGR